MEPLKKCQVEGHLMYAEPEDLFGNLDELCYVSLHYFYMSFRIMCSLYVVYVIKQQFEAVIDGNWVNEHRLSDPQFIMACAHRIESLRSS